MQLRDTTWWLGYIGALLLPSHQVHVGVSDALLPCIYQEHLCRSQLNRIIEGDHQPHHMR
jgi:hypothetical protein